MEKVWIDGSTLTIEDVVKVARGKAQVELDPKALPRMKASRDLVERVVEEARPVYGITTGFGKFADVSISEEDSRQLQKNLIMSHSCGVGEPFPEEIVRAMMLLRLNALSVGNSGISQNTFQTLLAALNKGVVPVIPCKGSLGASGDLAPLSHMVLTIIGEGEAFYQGVRMPSAEALKKAGITPCELTSKEGLALNNGTQAMNSIATLAVNDAAILSKTADIAAALSLEALQGIISAFDPRIQEVRHQPGQKKVAQNVRTILDGSKNVTKQGDLRVQDPYCLRCVPQIHGPSKDSLEYVTGIVSREINAVTDNPLIFAETDETFSGGNFHGQYLSMAMDFLGIAVAEFANVSERRIERMVNPQLSFGLPAFLVKNGGLNSGFMIPQYVAAALVSENKVLAHPAVVDSITSSANQEDLVSMGMTAARKAREIIFNVTNVLGIEVLVACQAIELAGRVETLAPATRAVFDRVRREIAFVENDRYLSPDIHKAAALVKSGEIVAACEAVTGKLF